MFIKSTLALAAVVAIATSSVALAQHSKRNDNTGWQSAPAQLEDFRSWGGEPKSYGAGHMPRAFYDQQQPGYPQSPPNGGGF